MKHATSIAIRIAAAYAAFGAVWILGSDQLVAFLVHDPDVLTMVQSWKGLLYVGLSALLIYAFAARLMKALTNSEQRYRALFAESPEALLIYDAATARIVEANAAACRLLETPQPDVIGRDISDFMVQACCDAFVSQSSRRAQLPHVSEFWRLALPGGRHADVSVHDQETVLGSGNGAGRQRQVLMIDVTARLRAETELLHSLDELAAANDRMQDLGHAVSHDLQEPLRQISGFVQLLERRYAALVDDDARQYINYAVEGVTRLKTLIADLERFTARPVQESGAVDAGAAAREAADGLRDAVARAEAQLHIADLPMVKTDPYRLAVVFHCLLENAVKFRRLDRPCAVNISAERHGEFWCFRVADNGIGIAPEYRSGIFALFRRLHTRDSIPGNGLGLALAKKMVESFGGAIWTEAADDGGAVMAFTVPALPPQAAGC